MKKFTLIELLVVIAIIGILTSMLWPSLSKAREKVKASVCLNNQRSVGQAMISYMSENNECTPDDEEGYEWYRKLIDTTLEKIWNDTGGYKILECPNGRELTKETHTNIATNPYLAGRGDDSLPIPAVNANPTETMMFIDSYRTWRSNWPTRITNMGKLLEEGEPDIIARHLQKANVTYIDGSGRLRGISYFLERSSNSHTFWDPEL